MRNLKMKFRRIEIYLTIREMQYIICIVRREALEKLENEVQTH